MRCHSAMAPGHAMIGRPALTCFLTGHSQARGRETEPIASAGSAGGAGEGGVSV